MKKVGDLFEELGFRKDGSEGVKRAFLKNLVRAANESAIERGQLPLKVQVAAPSKAPIKEQQLSFNFEALEETSGPETPFPTGKRNAG